MSLHVTRRHYAWGLVVLLCVAYLYIPFHRVSPAVMAPDLMRDFNLDAPWLGTLASIFFFGYGLMQLPAGILADSLGPRKILPATMLITALGSCLFAWAPGTLWLMLGRGLLGLGTAIIFIGALKVFSCWFSAGEAARVNGIFLGMGGLGIVFGAGPLAWACQSFGWRSVMLGTGFFAIVLALCMLKWLYNSPSEAGFGSVGGVIPTLNCAQITSGTLDGASQNTQNSWQDLLLPIISSGSFWLAAVWLFSQFTLHMSFGGLWGGPYLMDIHGYTRVEAGNILNLMGLGMVVGGPANGWLSDSVFKGRKLAMLFNGCIITSLFVILYLYGINLSIYGLGLWFFFLSFSGVGAVCIGFAAMRDLFGAKATGTASGLLNTLPSLGMILFQPLTGYILESQGQVGTAFSLAGYNYLFFLYVFVGFCGILAVFCLKEPYKK